jgi:lipopolysaccharide export system protein LptA
MIERPRASRVATSAGTKAVRGARALRRVVVASLLAVAATLSVGETRGQNAVAATTPPKPAEGASKEGDGFLGQLSLSSSNEPIVVRSDQLEFDYEANRVIYRGTVNVVQGDLAIDCKELLVNLARAGEQDDLELREVIAIGDVVITQGARRATGGRAVFDQQKRQITLLENPVLRDGPNEVAGERIVVYLDEGRSVVESSPKKRVSAILYPGKDGAPGATGGDAKAPGVTGDAKGKGKAKAAEAQAAAPVEGSSAATAPAAAAPPPPDTEARP